MRRPSQRLQQTPRRKSRLLQLFQNLLQTVAGFVAGRFYE
jgi:hypothetical protein